MVIIMMKARHSPLALSSQRRRKGILGSSCAHVRLCAYSLAAITLQSCHNTGKYIMRVFIQFDVELHSPLQASVQGSQAVDMFILLESGAPRPIAGRTEQDWRAEAPIAGRCMTPRAHPLHPSIFTPLVQKGWELLIGRCHEWQPLHKQAALPGAPPQLLWQQTSCWAGVYCVRLHNEHLDHGCKAKRRENRGFARCFCAFHAGI